MLRREGFVVSWLAMPVVAALQQEVDRLEPDAVLSDGGDSGGYGNSRDTAASSSARQPRGHLHCA